MESTVSYSDPHTSAGIQIANYDMENKSTPYLSLLQFFLNHRTFLRSRVAERVGKSPKQLMTGQAHAHWLTLLGFGLPQPLRA